VWQYARSVGDEGVQGFKSSRVQGWGERGVV